MPALGSRSLRKDAETPAFRRSTLNPYTRFEGDSRHSSATGLSAPPHHQPSKRAASVDVPRSGSSNRVRRLSGFVDPTPPSPPRELRPQTPRFSLLRFRNASEPQLSTKAREQAIQAAVPPVPAVPPTPAIITTAPTGEMENQDQDHPPLQRKRSKFHPFSRQKSSNKVANSPEHQRKNSEERVHKVEKRKSRFGTLRPGRGDPIEELRKLAGSRGSGHLLNLDGPKASSSNALPLQDSTERSKRDEDIPPGRISISTPGTPERPRPSHSRTAFAWVPGRRNKNRNSLFPLPVHIPPPDQQHSSKPDSPRLSTASTHVRHSQDSPSKHSPPRPTLSTLIAPRPSEDTSASIPTSTRAASSINFVPPGPSSLHRSNSLRSTPSIRSSPALPPMLGKRGRNRSSTMGSTGGVSDEAPPPTPPFATGGGSGRASTSTAGRSSLSNLFALNRLRHSSDPHSPRQGSPGHGLSMTPGGASHGNSLSLSREVVSLPERKEGETAMQYLERVEEIAKKRQIPTLLSKTGDEFLHNVMRSFMRKFAFFGEPLDMSTRKLLMEVELPKETQQIDRVIQGFADRYHECNPGIFADADSVYVTAFSLIILHTDIFNKHNKRKMTKDDYLKNSTSSQTCEDVLACFYDNISYTEFIQVEDDDDEMKTVNSKRSKRTAKSIKNVVPEPVRKTSKEPLDPYALMFENKLDILRPPIKENMNLDDQYTYLGTAPSLDKRLLKASKIGIIQIESARSRPDAFMSPSGIDNPEESNAGIVELPVEKVGVLWRKDPKKKTARSPWQEWGAILCSAGLYFFKNAHWVKTLISQYENHIRHGHQGTPVTFKPVIPEFKWNYMLPTDHGVALLDATYKRHKNAFVFCRPSGSEEIFLADNEAELNDWMAKLNYQAAFKSAGVRQRGLLGGHYDGQRQRALRRLESSHSATTVQTIQTPTGEVTIQSGKINPQLAQEISVARQEIIRQKIAEAEEKAGEVIKQIDSQLRDARHLLILAPIQPKTREQLVHAAGRMAARLKWMRIELWRLKCHRDILAMDIEEERREGQRRQARIDKVSGSGSSKAAPSITPETTPKPKPNGIDRFSSHSSTHTQTSPPRPSQNQSPGSSIGLPRPDTKMSHRFSTLTDADADIFATPAESPRFAPDSEYTTEPLTIKPPPTHRSSLTANRSPSLAPYQSIDEPLESPAFSEYRTPILDDEAAERRREAIGLGSSSTDGASPTPQPERLRPDTASDSERDTVPPAELTGSPESRNKSVRRSLQRSLRDSTHRDSLTHHRSSRHGHKASRSGGESTSSAVLREREDEDKDRLGKERKDEASDGEPLLRREKGSFTVHGKKASVITFGKEWEGMSAEERLRARRRAHKSGLEASGPADRPLSDASITPRGKERLREARDAAADDDALGAENAVEDGDEEGSIDMLVSASKHLRTLRSSSMSQSETGELYPSAASVSASQSFSGSRPQTRERQSSLSSATSEPMQGGGGGDGVQQNGIRVPARRSSLSLRDRRLRKNSAATSSAGTGSALASPTVGVKGALVEEETLRVGSDAATQGRDGKEKEEGGVNGKDSATDAGGEDESKENGIDSESPKAQVVQA